MKEEWSEEEKRGKWKKDKNEAVVKGENKEKERRKCAILCK